MNRRSNKSTNVVTLGIYSALIARDPNCAYRFINQYEEPISQDLNDHIRAANRFWREQLGNCPFVTMTERSYLIDAIEVDAWLNFFACEVVPTLVAASLPVEKPQARSFFEPLREGRWEFSILPATGHAL